MKIMTALIAALATAFPAVADVIRVPEDYYNFQDAFLNAQDGDEIRIAAGDRTILYTELSVPKSLTIVGAVGADGEILTHIRRNPWNSSASTNAILSTGRAPSAAAWHDKTITIKNIRFTNNSYDGEGPRTLDMFFDFNNHSLVIDNCEFYECDVASAVVSGHNMRDMTIRNTTFRSNRIRHDMPCCWPPSWLYTQRAAVWAYNPLSFKVEGCTFELNLASARSGNPIWAENATASCIYIISNISGTTEITDSIFRTNTADHGATIRLYGTYGSSTIKDCEFISNVSLATRDEAVPDSLGFQRSGVGAGAIELEGTSNTTISDCNFQMNTGGWAGAILCEHLRSNATLTVDDCNFGGNRGGWAGAINVFGGAPHQAGKKVVVRNSTFALNECTAPYQVPGNALSIFNQTAVITNNFFGGNTNPVYEHAIYFHIEPMHVSGSEISGNYFCQNRGITYTPPAEPPYSDSNIFDQECRDTDGDGVNDLYDPCPTWTGSCSWNSDTLIVEVGDDIQQAIDVLEDGGTVKLASGVHQITAPLVLGGKSLTIEGNNASGQSPWQPDTYIRAPGNCRVMEIDPVVGGEITIRNIVFWNGKADVGGGVLVRDNATATFERCWFWNNHARDGAGLAIMKRGRTTITECVSMSNAATGNGGGCWIGSGSDVDMSRFLVFANSAVLGGGMYATRGHASLNTCIIFGNEAIFGGGMYALNSGLDLNYRCQVNNNVAPYAAGIMLDGNGTQKTSLTWATISGNSSGGVFLNNGARPDVNICQITQNRTGVEVYNGSSPWIGASQICNNWEHQVFGGYRSSFWAPNCIGTQCNIINGLACLPLFPLTDTDTDSPAGPLLNTNFDRGVEGLEGWVRINNAHGASMFPEDRQQLPQAFHDSVRLFGSNWGTENVSGVSQNICWEPGRPIRYGADYLVPQGDPLFGMTDDCEFRTSPNQAYVALRIYRIDEAGGDDLWYEVPTEVVDGGTMEPGVPRSMSNTYVIPHDEASQISRVEFAIIFRQYDNFDSGSVYFTNAHADVVCGTPCTGDSDGDGLVGGEDLSGLLSAWGTDELAHDLDGDGLVGAEDLAILMQGWGPCSG